MTQTEKDAAVSNAVRLIFEPTSVIAARAENAIGSFITQCAASRKLTEMLLRGHVDMQIVYGPYREQGLWRIAQ